MERRLPEEISPRLQHQPLYVIAVQTNKSTKLRDSAQKGVIKTFTGTRRADKTNEDGGTYDGRNFHCEGG